MSAFRNERKFVDANFGCKIKGKINIEHNSEEYSYPYILFTTTQRSRHMWTLKKEYSEEEMESLCSRSTTFICNEKKHINEGITSYTYHEISRKV